MLICLLISVDIFIDVFGDIFGDIFIDIFIDISSDIFYLASRTYTLRVHYWLRTATYFLNSLVIFKA